MENKVLLLSFLCSIDIYSSSFKIFLACILGFSQLQCDCYYTHNIFSWKLFASAQEVGKTHVLWVSELTSSLPWLSHPGCLFWAGTDDAGEERQIAISPRSGILSFSHSYLSLFSVFSFRNFSFSTQDFSSLALQLLIITIVSTITALSVFAFLSWMIAHHGLPQTLATIFSANLGKVTELCWIKLGFGLQTAGPQGWAFQGDSTSTFAQEQRNMFHGCVHCSELRRQECFCLSLQILFALKLKRQEKNKDFS